MVNLWCVPSFEITTQEIVTTLDDGYLKERKWCFFLCSIVTFVFLWFGTYISFFGKLNLSSSENASDYAQLVSQIIRRGSRWTTQWMTIAWKRESGGASSSPPSSPSSLASPVFSSSEPSTQSSAKRWAVAEKHWFLLCSIEYFSCSKCMPLFS